MKKIYISENTISNVANGRLLPQFLFKLVKTHTTSLGDNEAFPSSDDYPFDYVLLKKRYNEVCDAIDDIGLVSLNEDDLVSELSSLVTECKRLEEPVRDALEKICENALNRLFAIPEESINMSFKLVDKIKFKSAIRMRPESNDDAKYTFKDIADIDLSNKAVGKRRFINALIQGAAYLYSGIEGLYIDDIDKINPKLPRLYRKIRIINDYLLFTKKEEMSDDKPMQGSYVETHLGIAGTKTTIKVQGLVFPLLFQESIKGLFELFSAHGLPQDRDKAQYIVKKADFVLAEPWDLRLGVGLWEMIFGGVEDTNIIPYMFTSFVKIPTNEFNLSVKEILSNTEKGNEIVNNLMKDAEYDNGYQQFTNRINAKNVDKSLIKDSYFTGAETNGYELDSDVEEGDVIEEDGIEELSHNTYQNASQQAFDNEDDNRVRKFRKGAEDAYNSNRSGLYGHGYDFTKEEDKWVKLIGNGKKLVIFDQQYKSLSDLINGLKQGRLLVHARGMVGEISNDMKYIYPCFDKTMMQFYKDTYDEIAASKSEYYGEEIEPEYPELIFASDSFSWSGGERNGVFFIESDGFQKSLGDGKIQLPNGKICNYWEGDIYDYDNELYKEEPFGVEYGDWYSNQPARVVAIMDLNNTIKESVENNSIEPNSEIMGIIANATVDNIDFIEGETDEYGEKVYLSVDGIEIPSELVNLDFRVVYKRFPTGKQQLLNIDIILDPQLRGYGLGTKIYAKAVREFGAICSRHATRHNDDGIRGIFGKLNSFNDIAVFQDTYNNLENETICDYYAILKSELPKYFGNNITESRELIYESQESKSIAAAKKLVMQRLNYNEQEADEFIRIKLRNDIPSLRTPQGGKFILGVTRMFCDGELRTANDIGNLNSTLKLVASDAHINEYDRNLNNLSCQELIQRFAKAMSDNLDAEKAEVGQMAFNTPSDYEIVRIDSFEQAEEYGDYVSWCVTHDEEMFDSYTSDGINQFYFCLKNGFENVEEVESEGCPLDEYGLSMIAVSVNENGMLNTCTCRWNHDNGGNDGIMNAKQVSQVIGMNFFEVFKPNNKWKELIANVMQRLANGEDPRNVFDSVGDFSEGFAAVRLNDKWNFINQEGRLLSDQWFNHVGIFSGGFAKVNLNGKYNFINQDGEIISDQWFDDVGYFKEGFAEVRLNGKWNCINQDGRVISDQWFDDVGKFSNGFAMVRFNGKWNFINQEGEIISDQWFDGVGYFSEGFARIRLNGKYNFINQEGRFLSDQWFDDVDYFREGFARVGLNGKWNFINQEGRFLSDQWFDDVDYFREGFARVGLNGKWNFINQEGRFLSDQWFDYVFDFREGFAGVKLNGKWNFINQEGRLLSDQWFDDVDYFREGFARVGLNGSKYKLDTRGNLSLIESKNKIGGKNILTESQESKSIAAAKKLVMQRLNYNEQEADEFIRIKLRNDIPSLRTPQGGKFILGVARMFCDGELRTANDIGNLNSTLKLVASDAHINEYDRNLNGMSCQELIQRFAKAMSDNLEAEKAEIGQMAFNTPSDYEIVRIDSFEQASNYGRYTSWCVTHQKNMFDSYTSDGINQFYFCLKNGFENVEEVPSEGCPLDEYGLSMIAVSVNGDGILNTCTCRWNHDNGGDDSIMNAKQVSQVIGMNFFEVFKPNNVWNDLVNDCISRVKNGEDTYDVFDSVGGFNASYDLEVVELQSKYNYIDENGNLLSKIWFDYASTFSSEGFGFVHLNSKKNLINKEGKFLIDRWIDEIYSVDQFHFKIRSGDKYNLLDKSWGLKIVSNMWFDNVEGFDEYGFARVGLIDNDALKVNLINKKGNLLSNIWFDDLTRYRKYSIVQKDGKYNILSTNGTVILNEWCDYIASLGYTFVVELNNKLNILNFKEGKLYDKWFDGDYCILNNNLIELADSNYVYLFNNNGSFNSIKQV